MDTDHHLDISIIKNEEKYQRALQTSGSYILRTNWTEAHPQRILRVFSRPSKELKLLLQRLKIPLPNKSGIIQR